MPSHATANGSLPDAGQPPATPVDRRDRIVMALMVAVYLAVALFNLGSFTAPSTVWQPLQPGAWFDIDLGKGIDIARIYYFNGINESRYDNAKFFILAKQGEEFHQVAAIEKKECGTWRYVEAPVRTSRLKLVASPPGGALNEMVIVEKGSRTPYAGFRIVPSGTAGSDPKRLFDEQGTFQYRPSFLHGFYFDEIYHARTAYEHLQAMEPYETTHPPLGKLLISAGIALFGMTPFGWRIVGTLFGAAMLPIMYLFGKKLFGGRLAPFCAAFLLMVDFMHFAHTRLAVVDVYAATFIVLMFYFIHDFYVHSGSDPPDIRRPLVLSGLCFGLGAASKWLSLYAGAGLATLIVLQLYRQYRIEWPGAGSSFLRTRLLPVLFYGLICFVLMPALLYLLSYLPFTMVQGPGHSWSDVLLIQRHMFAYHSQLKATHPFSSPWWSWPLDARPVWLYTATDLPRGQASSIASFGNPAVWWAGLPTVVAAPIIALVRRDRRMMIIFTGLACQYLPWALIPRLAFIYHFFSVLPFMILSQVYVIQAAVKRWPLSRFGVYLYLAVAGLLFVVFYPVLSGLEVSENYIARLRWLDNWTF